MNKTLLALLLVLVMATVAQAGWYVGPRVVQAYYPVGPVYAYPAPVAVAPAPYVTYSPVVAAPVITEPVMAAPVVAAGPVWVAPAPVVVRSRVFIPGRPVRNVVRAVLPY